MRRAVVIAVIALALRSLPVGAAANSTTRLWSPAPPTGGANTGFPSANVLVCSAWVPPLGITNATSISWFLTGGLGGGGLCSVTLYSADGSTQIGTSGAVNCSGTGAVAATGLSAFSLTAAVKVQACICANVSGGSYLGADTGTGGGTQALQNALGTPLVTTAANACTAGVPPVTTGALTATVSNAPIFLLGTATP